MRILYSHRIQSRDGQSVHVEEMVRAMRETGHEVLVVGPGFYEDSGFGGESKAVAVLRKLLPGALQEFAELAYNVPAFLRLRKAASSFKPDIVYERYNLYYLAGTILVRMTGLPYLLEVNSPLADERSRHGGLKLQRLAHFLERWTWKTADRVLPVTGVLRDMIAATGIALDRLSVVQNGVVLSRFPKAEPAPHDPTRRVRLGFVGFVRDWHGMDAVIRAMATQPTSTSGAGTVELVIIGDGPVRSELEALALSCGIPDRVRFTGVVEHEEVPAQVAAFDIALQPRVTSYASPLKIFDYMAAGCAIVAPDQPNIREVLEHNRTALLVDPDAPGAMWNAIAHLANNPELRRQLGQAARAELEHQNYTWQGNAHRITNWAADHMAHRRSGKGK